MKVVDLFILGAQKNEGYLIGEMFSFAGSAPILVGGWPTPLKKMSSSVGIIIPNIWNNKKCSKPPTSISL